MTLCRVKGDSMHPLIRDGDMLFVEKCLYDNLKWGDIVVYNSVDGFPIVHRLIRKLVDNKLEIRGDGYLSVTEIVGMSKIIGRAVSINRNGKQIRIRSWNSFWYLIYTRIRIIKIKIRKMLIGR